MMNEIILNLFPLRILYVNGDIYLGEITNFKKNDDKFDSLILSDEIKFTQNLKIMCQMVRLKYVTFLFQKQFY